MTSPLFKWQLALAGIAVAGISGWVVAWRLWQERGELESRLGHRAVPTVIQPQSGKPVPPPADTGPGLVKLIRDKRTAAFVERLPEIVAAARAGVRNERYVQAANELLQDNNWERRTRNFGLLMENLRPEDAPAIHQAFAALNRQGRPYAEEYRSFATQWGEVDGKGAMEYFKSNADPRIAAWDAQQIMKGWGQAAPQDALRWLAENPDIMKEYSPANAVLQGWSRNDPDAATSWLLTNSTAPDMTARGVSEIVLEQLYAKGIKGAGEWLAALPDTDDANAASHTGWMAIQRRFTQLSSEDAGALWRSVGNRSWMGWNDFERFSGLVAAVNGGSDAAFLAAAGGESTGDISRQFERWAASEPEMTSNWLTKHPENSSFRTAAITGMVHYLEKTDPEAASAWRKQIPR